MFKTLVIRPCVVEKKRGAVWIDGGQDHSAQNKVKPSGDDLELQLPTHLHDQEVRIVDVELHRMEEVLYALRSGVVAVDEVFVAATNHDLAVDGDLVVLLVANRALFLVLIVKDNGHAGTRHTRLAIFVHQLLQRAGADLVREEG